MYKKIFIVPYFGKFPNYFQLVLNSCEKNSDFDWLIITDIENEYTYPKNVFILKKTFKEIKEMIQKKFDFEICLNTPHKFCDFKPVYGYIFQEYIRGYDFWGYCDIDIIFGKLSNFITDELLNKYEKLFVYGHMTLYKNTEENNKMFMKPLNGEEIYKKYLSKKFTYGFDELWENSINNIFLQYGKDIYVEKLCADILPREVNFRLALGHDKNYSDEFFEKKRKSLFVYEDGIINRYYIKDEKLKKLEYMYIHLQKRKMEINKNILNYKNYIIIPNNFIGLKEVVNLENYNNLKKYKLSFNYFKHFFIGRKKAFKVFIGSLLSEKLKRKFRKKD